MHAIAIGEHRSMSVERIIRDLETVYTYRLQYNCLSIYLADKSAVMPNEIPQCGGYLF